VVSYNGSETLPSQSLWNALHSQAIPNARIPNIHLLSIVDTDDLILFYNSVVFCAHDFDALEDLCRRIGRERLD